MPRETGMAGSWRSDSCLTYLAATTPERRRTRFRKMPDIGILSP